VAPSATGEPAEPLPDLPPAPHVFLTGTGEFEIASVDLVAARNGTKLAEEIWRTLDTPLLLPAAGFSQPITVRVLPLAAGTKERASFQANAELGGRVGVTVRWTADAAGDDALRRGLVQALLMRRAIAWHGLVTELRVPFWLENACVRWTETRERPALLDAWQQDAARVAMPRLAAVLSQQRLAAADPAADLAALGLMAHLQAESGREQRWPQLLRAVLGGTETLAALPLYYGDYFKDDAARELWWQVGWQAQLRQAAQAGETPAESRQWLVERAHWTARLTKDAPDAELTLDEVYAARAEAWVTRELAERLAELRAGLGTVHPFYRNAALSLGRVYESALFGDRRGFNKAQADLVRDIADGRELEQISKEALDELEAGLPKNGK